MIISWPGMNCFDCGGEMDPYDITFEEEADAWVCWAWCSACGYGGAVELAEVNGYLEVTK